MSIEALIWIVIAGIMVLLGFSNCAAVPAAVGYFGSGGVTLYKSAKESGPKAEFVLIKLQVEHNNHYYYDPKTK